MSFAVLATYWHERSRQAVWVVTSPSFHFSVTALVAARDRQAHSFCRIYGEGIMYGRDNMGIGLR